MDRFIRGLLVAAVMAVGSLLAGTSVSAATLAPAAATGHVAAAQVSTTVKPPVIKRVRVACHPEGAIVSLTLRNPNKTELSFQIRLSGGDVQVAQAVTLSGKTAERVRFDGIPNDEYEITVLNAAGDTVASADVAVDCTPVA
jgi:hypothetical protein